MRTISKTALSTRLYVQYNDAQHVEISSPAIGEVCLAITDEVGKNTIATLKDSRWSFKDEASSKIFFHILTLEDNQGNRTVGKKVTRAINKILTMAAKRDTLIEFDCLKRRIKIKVKKYIKAI